jgi:hypothetical protein
MCPGTAALAYANGELTAGTTGNGIGGMEAQAGLQLEETVVNADTHQMKTGMYLVKNDVTINPTQLLQSPKTRPPRAVSSVW